MALFCTAGMHPPTSENHTKQIENARIRLFSSGIPRDCSASLSSPRKVFRSVTSSDKIFRYDPPETAPPGQGTEPVPMIFSNPTEYAIRGLSELVCRSPASTGRMMIEELVRGTDLPRDFMAKIFQKLARAGILSSSKGRGGGFSLARPAHEIRLIDIIEVLEGPQCSDRCVVGLEKCTDHMPCPQHDLYKPIRQRLKDYLATTTLADLAASLKAKQAWQKMRQFAVERT